MPEPHDYIIMPVTEEMVTIARWFAQRRILYEYPEHDQRVFGDYGEGQVGTIAQGLIAELAVFDYLHDGLVEAFGDLDPVQRNQVVAGRLSTNIIVGRYDPGHDVQVVNRSLDVKSYGTERVSLERIGQLNLLINANQAAGREVSDYYVQAFFTLDDQIVLAGYHEGLPPYNPRFPSPAYACRVADLRPMAALRRLVTA